MTPKKVTYKPKIKPKINPSVIAGVGHAEIDDGQHHKNEGLQCDHQQMEDQPAEIQQGLDRQHEVHHGAYRGAAQQRDQQEQEQQEEADRAQHQKEEENDEQEHRERHREGGIEVGGWHHF